MAGADVAGAAAAVATGQLVQTPQTGCFAPHTTPISTPEAAAAAAARLPVDQVASALAGFTEHELQQQQAAAAAAAAAASGAAREAVDPEAGFAGFFSPPSAGAAPGAGGPTRLATPEGAPAGEGVAPGSAAAAAAAEADLQNRATCGNPTAGKHSSCAGCQMMVAAAV